MCFPEEACWHEQRSKRLPYEALPTAMLETFVEKQ